MSIVELLTLVMQDGVSVLLVPGGNIRITGDKLSFLEKWLPELKARKVELVKHFSFYQEWGDPCPSLQGLEQGSSQVIDCQAFPPDEYTLPTTTASCPRRQNPDCAGSECDHYKGGNPNGY